MTSTRKVHTDKHVAIEQIGRLAAAYKTHVDAHRLTGLLDKLTASELQDVLDLLDDGWNAGGRAKAEAMELTGDGPGAVKYFRDWTQELTAAASVLADANGFRPREAALDALQRVAVDPSSRKIPKPKAGQEAGSDPLVETAAGLAAAVRGVKVLNAVAETNAKATTQAVEAFTEAIDDGLADSGGRPRKARRKASG